MNSVDDQDRKMRELAAATDNPHPLRHDTGLASDAEALSSVASVHLLARPPSFPMRCVPRSHSAIPRTIVMVDNRSFAHVCLFLFQSKLSWLLVAVPASVIIKATRWDSKVLLFLASLAGIVPLAERLGHATEQLAFHTGATVGGLLNATFGNATEIIICICALHNGLMRVVQLSLLGSILSNVLLVQGCAFFLGGIFHLDRGQKFSKAVAGVNCGLLLMTVMGVLLPAVLHSTHTQTKDGILCLSRFSSCVMLLAYASFLFFQLKSHKHLYDISNESDLIEDDGEVEMSRWAAVFWLAAVTVLISFLSNNVVDAIEGASVSMGIPLPFISVIILPIAGNAAEHAGAIIFAVKNKLDLSLAVAIGSSIQISMFVIPFCVVLGWIMGKGMDLDFQVFETATLMVTVIVVAFLLQEGKSNYFKGLMLILCYLIVAASFFVHDDYPSPGKGLAL